MAEEELQHMEMEVVLPHTEARHLLMEILTSILQLELPRMEMIMEEPRPMDMIVEELQLMETVKTVALLHTAALLIVEELLHTITTLEGHLDMKVSRQEHQIMTRAKHHHTLMILIPVSFYSFFNFRNSINLQQRVQHMILSQMNLTIMHQQEHQRLILVVLQVMKRMTVAALLMIQNLPAKLKILGIHHHRPTILLPTRILFQLQVL